MPSMELVVGIQRRSAPNGTVAVRSAPQDSGPTTEIFMSNIPYDLNAAGLKRTLIPRLKSIGCYASDVQVWGNGQRVQGKLTLPSVELAETFLRCYGALERGRPRMQIHALNRPIHCRRSNRPTGDIHLIKSLKEMQDRKIKELQDEKIRKERANQGPAMEKKFEIVGLELGVFASSQYTENASAFINRWTSSSKTGTVIFKKKAVVIELDTEPDARPDADTYSLRFDNQRVRIFTDSHSTIFFESDIAPRIYRHQKKTDHDVRIRQGETETKHRIPGIDTEHQLHSAYAFVYKVPLADHGKHEKVTRLSEKLGIPPIEPKVIKFELPAKPFVSAFMELLKAFDDKISFPWLVAFQIHALFSGGQLSPENVIALLPRIKEIVQAYGAENAASIIFDFVTVEVRYSVDPISFPNSGSSEYVLNSFNQCIEKVRGMLTRERQAELATQRKESLAFIHRVMITPTGVFAYGPTWEPQNRVLRKYKDYHEFFLRVQFVEEDGEQFMHEAWIESEPIYREFLSRIDPMSNEGRIIIGGRVFSFLGFSSSSLRSGCVWYMAEFNHGGETITTQKVINDLGDFSGITIPGRYAARVGQAFSDTIDSIVVSLEAEKRIPDVERLDSSKERRLFTDGVGKVSLEMVKRIWKSSKQLGTLEPTVFQIRYGGAKGMIALDPTLDGDQLCLRPSMEKFSGSMDRNIEICSWGVPLRMYLNRPLIKVLEDLGIVNTTFKDIQNDAIQKLRHASTSLAYASHFFRKQSVSSPALRLPWIIDALKNIGISFWDDGFMERAFELSLLMVLRSIKYKGRIPVEGGVTLIGVVDETGFLQEGEVYAHTEIDDKDEVIQGTLMITRSPVHHPGDIQMVTAVMPPRGSPLLLLKNCVAFSTKGDRPLPSMLSGGDLDGDLYNLIWDSRFHLRKPVPAADYPLSNPVDLGRPVTQSDVAKFFIDFMKNNLLGLISSKHLLIADQKEEGVFHPDALKLAELASVAVDFPKTGKQVERINFPKVGSARPDFMAPGPRVLLSDKNKVLHEVEQNRGDEEEDEDDAPTNYYESEKVLGVLYRSIDEQQFLADIHTNIRRTSASRNKVLAGIWEYAAIQTFQTRPEFGQWPLHLDTAKDIRERYESRMSELQNQYSERPWKSILTEVEVFVGCIVGKGGQSKRQREDSTEMKKEYDYLAATTTAEIRGGTRKESIEKALACLQLCILEGEAVSVRQRLQSFAWIAISVLLWELDLLQKETDRILRKQQGGRYR